jgi:hypothetical protein
MLVCAGEAEEEGYEDEYALEDLEVTAADYIKPVAASNFRNSWDQLDPDTEVADDYGLGERETLQARISIRSAYVSLKQHVVELHGTRMPRHADTTRCIASIQSSNE